MRYLMTGCMVLLAVATAGCGGRIANPVPAQAALDHNLSCKEVRAEVAANDDQTNNLNLEVAARQRDNKNILFNEYPYFLVPSVFGFDRTIVNEDEKPQRAEAVALQARNQHLLALAKDAGC